MNSVKLKAIPINQNADFTYSLVSKENTFTPPSEDIQVAHDVNDAKSPKNSSRRESLIKNEINKASDFKLSLTCLRYNNSESELNSPILPLFRSPQISQQTIPSQSPIPSFISAIDISKQFDDHCYKSNFPLNSQNIIKNNNSTKNDHYFKKPNFVTNPNYIESFKHSDNYLQHSSFNSSSIPRTFRIGSGGNIFQN